MVDEEDLLSADSGENIMLREAIEALRLGDRVRARDLLTRLLKTDQNNVNYWLWLSATVDSQKERLYCLQTALKVDPENTAAKRGLILLGAIPPDDSIPPFPVNRPRLWEEKLELPKEPQEKKHGWANPLVRVFAILGIAVLVVGLYFGATILFPASNKPQRLFVVPTTEKTGTVTVEETSSTPGLQTATPTFLGPTPLSLFLKKTYTPTPLYVVTEHPATSKGAFDAGLRFLAKGDYSNALNLFEQASTLEPNAADYYYYIGETQRLNGNLYSAIDAYERAIRVDSKFAPAYLGRARVNLLISPIADVMSDLDSAVILDPHFAEAYLERGKYLVTRSPKDALTDLEVVLELTPDSALAYLYTAQAQMILGNNEAALEAALQANRIDMTLIPDYLVLAQAYIATGQLDKAVGPLQTYIVYEPNDARSYISLATSYNTIGEYQLAIEVLNLAITADPRNADAYTQRGFAYLNLEKASLAQMDYQEAISLNPEIFDAQLGLARTYNDLGSAEKGYNYIETKALGKAKTTSQKAEAYYWEAIFLENMNDAAGAKATWSRLIALPEDAMPQAWRDQAFLHLNITPTRTPTASKTRTPTATQKP
jgi:tetratricopeptide (TPR) repeat protein